MKVAMICGLHPSNDSELIKKSIIMPQYAAHRTAAALAEGFYLHMQDDFTILNIPFVGSYPKQHKMLHVPSYEWVFMGKKQAPTIAFNNLFGFRQISRKNAVASSLLKWVYENQDEDMFVIVYALTTPFLQAVKQAKAINSKLKACLIVPDLPQYMDADSSLVYRTLKSIDIKKQKTLLKEIDMFTLVSSHMASALNIDKPFIVIEGVIDTKKLPISLNSPMPEHEFVIKKIVYTGGVNTEYGIEGLLKAFSLVKGQDYALIIAGSGNAVQMVKEYAEKDSRIQFLGTLSIEESIKLQGEATLLINPRQPDKDFVKYSFPSKTLEYMMAGKPVLMFKLDGIPNEYDEFLYYFENNNDYEGMAKKIVDICSLPAKQKFERCRKAIEFLRNEKNVLNQTDKILKLLSQI